MKQRTASRQHGKDAKHRAKARKARCSIALNWLQLENVLRQVADGGRVTVSHLNIKVCTLISLFSVEHFSRMAARTGCYSYVFQCYSSTWLLSLFSDIFSNLNSVCEDFADSWYFIYVQTNQVWNYWVESVHSRSRKTEQGMHVCQLQALK